MALLYVALEHELDLACDIAYYGPSNYPMTARLLRALSLPGQFEQLMGAKTPTTPIRDENGAIGFGEP